MELLMTCPVCKSRLKPHLHMVKVCDKCKVAWEVESAYLDAVKYRYAPVYIGTPIKKREMTSDEKAYLAGDI